MKDNLEQEKTIESMYNDNYDHAETIAELTRTKARIRQDQAHVREVRTILRQKVYDFKGTVSEALELGLVKINL